MPGPVLRRKRPARHDVVNVRVGLPLAPPRVEHAEEARLIAPDEAGVTDQGFDGLGRGFEERPLAQPLMVIEKRPQGFGHGEGEPEGRATGAPATGVTCGAGTEGSGGGCSPRTDSRPSRGSRCGTGRGPR
jgi:hypothetical protein